MQARRRGTRRRSASSLYFDEPFYVGFNIGGYELGLDPNMSGVTLGTSVVTYWGVPDIAAAHDRLLRQGAKGHEPITDVGGEIKVATVTDPFGNLIGIIENPHFKVAGRADSGSGRVRGSAFTFCSRFATVLGSRFANPEPNGELRTERRTPNCTVNPEPPNLEVEFPPTKSTPSPSTYQQVE